MKRQYEKPLTRAIIIARQTELMYNSKEHGEKDPSDPDGRSKRTWFEDEDQNLPFHIKAKGNYNAWDEEI